MTQTSLDSLASSKINSRHECWLFLRWVITKRDFYPTFKWFVRKCYNRFFKTSYGLDAYPNEIRTLAMHIDETSDAFSFGHTNETQVTSHKGPDSIRLAGTCIDIMGGDIDWQSMFSDREDEESLHRWNFLLYLLSREKPEANSLYWALEQIDRWVIEFQHEILTVKENSGTIPRWESYTISERLSNSSIFFHVSKITPSDKIVNALIEQASYLTKNLEYYGDYTSNHIVNNGRALYLFGVNFGIERFIKLGQVVLEHELPNLVSPAGFVREGSAHYQFLVTRWLLEVRHFYPPIRDKNFSQMIEEYCKKLEDKCRFFISEDSCSKSPSYPLFGDISPDFPPEWLANILTSQLGCKSPPDNHVPSFPESSWNWIWE